MTPPEDDLAVETAEPATDAGGPDTGDPDTDAEQDERLDLQVDIATPSACERHVSVAISRADIDRYMDNAFSSMMPEAAVPGFRAGKAPRKLVEQRYKSEVADQVKGSLLMDSLSQVSEESEFAAISEPELNLDAVEIPDEGPLTFEFDIEVRPDFDLPKWKGLKIDRPVREFTEEDIEFEVQQALARYGQLAPHRGAAEEGDYVTLEVVATADGDEAARHEELQVRVLPKLSFIDGTLEGFGELMAGAEAGAKKTAKVTLTADAPNEDLRGKEVELAIEVLDVKRIKLPELTEDLLQELGGFEDEAAMREAIQQNLQRQLDYAQQQKSREQITALLTESANWELPPGLLKRQSSRELERAVMELRRSGFPESEIRARENQLRQNSAESTAMALKEHFILERVAEEENLEVEEGDYEKEIFLMAMQSGESPRRVRAQLEKRGMMDVLRNQIVERKVIEAVQAEAKFKDQPYEPDRPDTEAASVAVAGGGVSDIPEAVDAEEVETETAAATEK